MKTETLRLAKALENEIAEMEDHLRQLGNIREKSGKSLNMGIHGYGSFYFKETHCPISLADFVTMYEMKLRTAIEETVKALEAL